MERSRDYHVRRGREELDLAYRADTRIVMEAHLKLCALHMAKVKDPVALNVSATSSQPSPEPWGPCEVPRGTLQLDRETPEIPDRWSRTMPRSLRDEGNGACTRV